MDQFLWVCLGSALGGGLRYLASEWALRVWGPAFPVGTVGVNLLGSFALAALMGAGADGWSPSLRLALTTGLMGGFTTYSTFNFDTFRCLQQGAYGAAFLHVVVTLAGCLLASAAGFALGRGLGGAP